jgi:hypothetical protein
MSLYVRWTQRGDNRDDVHYPTRPVDRDKAEAELAINIKKATNPDETAPKAKHVRSTHGDIDCLLTH